MIVVLMFALPVFEDTYIYTELSSGNHLEIYSAPIKFAAICITYESASIYFVACNGVFTNGVTPV